MLICYFLVLYINRIFFFIHRNLLDFCRLEMSFEIKVILFQSVFARLKKSRIFATAFEKRSSSSAGRAHPF